MRISVKFFASLREEMGRGDETLDLEDGATMAEVWQMVSEQRPQENLLCSRNREYAHWNDVAADGDEVAFFPPVTGG